MAIGDAAMEQRIRVKERHSKVRTGCSTCKQRHVKCDEKRPAPCERCTKGGYKCGGYVDPPKPWFFEYNKDAGTKKDVVTSASGQLFGKFYETAPTPTEFVEVSAPQNPVPTWAEVQALGSSAIVTRESRHKCPGVLPGLYISITSLFTDASLEY